MNTFSNELRKEREAKNITLADIARTTRISIKYLQAIDQGTFDILPQTYIRAFIKAYAEAIGLNPADVLVKYDIHSTPEHKEETYATKDKGNFHLRPELTDEELKNDKKFRAGIALSVFAAVLFFVALYLWNNVETIAPSQSVKETAFQDVVKEQEDLRPAPPAVDTVDSLRAGVPASPAVDSLVLRFVSTDSVWITIIRDSLPPRSGYMLKGRYRTYVAKKGFSVSLSDGGAMRVFLNGKELPPLGPKGRRVRNVSITAENL